MKVVLTRADAAAIWKAVALAATAACSIGIEARSVAPAIPKVSTIARLVARRIGAATGIAIRMVTWITAVAFARTVNVAVSSNANNNVHAVVAAIVAAPGRRRVARAVRSVAAALRATRTTISTRARQSLRRRIRITHCVARAIS